jgi:hypothetical protein
VNFKRHGLAALRRDQRRGVLPGDACQARGRFGWDPSGAVCGAATLDRQHGMAAPPSGRQPELIPTAYLSIRRRQESRSSSSSSVSWDRPVKNQPDYTGLDSQDYTPPGLHSRDYTSRDYTLLPNLAL